MLGLLLFCFILMNQFLKVLLSGNALRFIVTVSTGVPVGLFCFLSLLLLFLLEFEVFLLVALPSHGLFFLDFWLLGFDDFFPPKNAESSTIHAVY